MGDIRGLGARDEWAFSWRLPRLGYIVSKLRKHHGGDEVSTPMLVTEIVYPQAEPDEACVGGYYLLDPEDLRKYHGAVLHQSQCSKLPYEDVPGVVYGI